jgi:hypothetical protein
MVSDDLERLRAELAGLTGGARMAPLVRLGRQLMERYWRAGIGRPEGLPDLNEAIERMEEAFEHAEDGDVYRGNIAAYAGWFRCGRYLAHGESDDDRETGISMLELALATPSLPPMLRTMSLVWAGQLYFGRVALFLQAPGSMMNLMSGQVPAELVGGLDRAVECLAEAIESKSASADLIEGVEATLTMVEVVRTMLRGKGAGMDTRKLVDAIAMTQKFQARVGVRGAAQADPSFIAFESMRELLRSDVIDRPGLVMRDDSASEQAGPPRVVEPVQEQEAETPVDRESLRGQVRAALFGDEGGSSTVSEVAALLRPDAPALDVDTVDDAVALARSVVDFAGDGEGACPQDWFTLAVTLGLRHRLDVDGDDVDRADGLSSLLTAVRGMPAGGAGTGTMLATLGAFLTEDQPFDDTLDGVAEEFADRIDAVVATAAVTDAAELMTLHALRCLCRAAEVLAELRRAPVPVEYPWRAAMLAAAAITEAR